MADIAVKPVRKGMELAHPSAGLLPDEGGLWPPDQFTFRRLRDGDIERVEAKAKAQDADDGSGGAEGPSAAADVPATTDEVDPYPETAEADPLEIGTKRKGKA